MNGRDGLIAHLRSTGTGEAKLAIAAQVDLGNLTDEVFQITFTIECMEQRGVNQITLGKARKYLESRINALSIATAPTAKPTNARQPRQAKAHSADRL